MGLLVDLWTTSLEPGYATETARRRAATEAGGSRRGRRTTTLVAGLALVAAGLLLATAAGEARLRAPAALQARQGLLEQVEARTLDTDQLQSRVASEEVTLSAERDAALARSRDSQALTERLRDLELLAGAAPVTGPGLRVTLDDAPPSASDTLGAGDSGGEIQPGRLLDRDLQDVVNALWAAGAEAVAVEGQRLSALSAISNAGDAILVDFRPTSPPYVVEAIGDPTRLELAFVDSPTGRRFGTYVSLLGITFDVSGEESLTLPAAVLRDDAGSGTP